MKISKDLFLSKYSFFSPDKDGLVSIQELKGGYFVHEGYILDIFFIPYSEYFKFDGTNKETWINYRLLGSLTYELAIKVSIRFDLDKIGYSIDYVDGELGAGGRGIPVFDIDKLLSLKNDNLSEKHRRNTAFNSLMNNEIYRTEFYYQSADKSLHIEEITDTRIYGYFVNRFQHTIFKDRDTISHYDGAMLFYTASDKEDRFATSLDKKLKNAKEYIKLFRIDSEIDVETWLFLTEYWFVNNELVLEWIDTDAYEKEYKDILLQNIDF